MTLAEKTKLIDWLVLVVPLQSYTQSVDVFDLRDYDDLKDHPDFAKLKQAFEGRSQQIQHENKLKSSKRSTIKSISVENQPGVPWFRSKSMKSRTPTIDEEVDEEHYKDFKRYGAKDIDYDWIIKCKCDFILLFIAYISSQNRMNALKMLHENINNDI